MTEILSSVDAYKGSAHYTFSIIIKVKNILQRFLEISSWIYTCLPYTLYNNIQLIEFSDNYNLID